MRKLFRKFLPHHETVKDHRWLKPFGGWLHHPNLWHLHRRSVAGGGAIGLFCGLIPGPVQMISAALLAVSLAIAGYFAVRVVWRVAVIWKWRARKKRTEDRGHNQ